MSIRVAVAAPASEPCYHHWSEVASLPGRFRCERCRVLSACPVCLGLGDQGVFSGGVLIRYCDLHLAGVFQAPSRHAHIWVRLPDSVGFFSCHHAHCLWCAVCPGCLGSLDVALRVQSGIPGMVSYWCPEHDGMVR